MSPHRADTALTFATAIAVALTLTLLGAVLWVIVGGALPGLYAYGIAGFFGSAIWQPSAGKVGALAMIAGTGFVTGMAMLFALPLGICAAIGSAWLLPQRVGHLLRLIMLVTAGIPSVVIGLWGLTALVPLVASWHPPGASALVASVVLSLMVAPTVMVIVDDALRSIPLSQRRAAASLGLTHWGSLLAIAMPSLRRGSLTAGGVATARALGETMAVVLVAGNVVQVPGSVFDSVRTLTAGIALEMAYATGNHRSALIVLGLIALLVVMGMLVLLHVLVPDATESPRHA